MRDEPTDGRVDRPIERRVLVRHRWRAISFVGHLRFLIRCAPQGPTGISPDQDNQGHNSNGTENAEDDDGYEPRPKAIAGLEDRGSSHGLSSEMSSGDKEWRLWA